MLQTNGLVCPAIATPHEPQMAKLHKFRVSHLE